MSEAHNSSTVRALAPLREDWHSALALVAHPDDLEYGAASAIARWTKQGKRIAYCLMTSGEAGIDGMAPDQAREVREQEQITSAALVGVDDVDFLGLPDGVLEYGVALRRAVARQVRRYRPEILVTNNFRDTWGGGELNQADHIATGRAILDGVRDAGNRWIFPELTREGLEPWNGTSEVWAAYSPQAGHGVDVTETLALGLASLRAHEAYLQGLDQPDFDHEGFLVELAQQTGRRLECEFGVAFEVITVG